MKTLSNNRGISLVILVIAMTLIAMLGAAFVSIIATKHRGFLHQNDSYRALNIANAGVEYAVRYISDGLSDKSSAYYTGLPTQSINNVQFGGGSFSVTRNYSLTISNDYIEVTGTYRNSARKAKLSNFRRYLTPLTLSPAQAPYIGSGYYVYIPMIGNQSTPLSVSRIDLAVGQSGRYLRYIWLNNSRTNSGFGGWEIIFDSDDAYWEYWDCPSTPPCWDIRGIQLPYPGTITLDPSKYLYTRDVASDEVNMYCLQFSAAIGAPSGQYTFRLNTTPVTSTVRFIP